MLQQGNNYQIWNLPKPRGRVKVDFSFSGLFAGAGLFVGAAGFGAVVGGLEDLLKRFWKESLDARVGEGLAGEELGGWGFWRWEEEWGEWEWEEVELGEGVSGCFLGGGGSYVFSCTFSAVLKITAIIHS